MENSQFRTPIILLFLLVIIGMRVLMPLSPDFKFIAGFSGVGAAALFGGSYFKNKLHAFLWPLVVLLLSDLGLILTMGVEYGIYDGMQYTYLAFFAMTAVGHFMIKKSSFSSVFLASLVAVFLHWIIADFGVWYGSKLFPQTWSGFMTCLVEAIPYEKNFLIGTLVYASLLFGAYELLAARFSFLSRESVA